MNPAIDPHSHSSSVRGHGGSRHPDSTPVSRARASERIDSMEMPSIAQVMGGAQAPAGTQPHNVRRASDLPPWRFVEPGIVGVKVRQHTGDRTALETTFEIPVELAEDIAAAAAEGESVEEIAGWLKDEEEMAPQQALLTARVFYRFDVSRCEPMEEPASSAHAEPSQATSKRSADMPPAWTYKVLGYRLNADDTVTSKLKPRTGEEATLTVPLAFAEGIAARAAQDVSSADIAEELVSSRSPKLDPQEAALLVRAFCGFDKKLCADDKVLGYQLDVGDTVTAKLKSWTGQQITLTLPLALAQQVVAQVAGKVPADAIAKGLQAVRSLDLDLEEAGRLVRAFSGFDLKLCEGYEILGYRLDAHQMVTARLKSWAAKQSELTVPLAAAQKIAAEVKANPEIAEVAEALQSVRTLNFSPQQAMQLVLAFSGFELTHCSSPGEPWPDEETLQAEDTAAGSGRNTAEEPRSQRAQTPPRRPYALQPGGEAEGRAGEDVVMQDAPPPAEEGPASGKRRRESLDDASGGILNPDQVRRAQLMVDSRATTAQLAQFLMTLEPRLDEGMAAVLAARFKPRVQQAIGDGTTSAAGVSAFDRSKYKLDDLDIPPRTQARLLDAAKNGERERLEGIVDRTLNDLEPDQQAWVIDYFWLDAGQPPRS